MTYDRSYIVEKFRGLIGFQPSYDYANFDAMIDEDLAISSSGQFANRLHTLFTPENFANCLQQFSQFNVKTWVTGTTYLTDSVVKYNGKIYQAIKQNVSQSPDTNTDDWKKTTLLSVWFRNVYDGAVLDVIDRVMEQKKLDGHGKQLLRDDVAVFSRNGYSADTVTKSGRFVGFEINLKHPNMSVKLKRVGLQLSKAMNVPIRIIYRGTEQDIDFDYIQGNKQFQYLSIDSPAFLSFEGSAIIGYEEDDLNDASAIFQNTTIFNDDYCATCGGSDSGSRNSWSQFIDLNPITIINGEMEYTTDTNFGLNLVFGFACDFSDIMISQKDLLIPSLKAQLRISLLQVLADSTRVNSEANVIGNLAFNELKDPMNPQNPTKYLERAIKALSFEFSGLYGKCLPCENKVSYRIRSIS